MQTKRLTRIVAMLTAGWITLTAGAQTQYDPQPDPQAIVHAGNARFTVLTPEMIRIQYSDAKIWEDRATFAIVNRRLPVPRYTTQTENGYLYITTDRLRLRYKLGADFKSHPNDPELLRIDMKLKGRDIVWYPGKDDALNLMGTTRTLDGQTGESKRKELERGILSRGGWTLIDESPLTKRGDGSTTFAFDGDVNGMPWVAEPRDKQAIDWYFMGYGHDYKKALNDYTRVGGKIPMPPMYVLGYWYSKYQAYSQQEFMDIVNDVDSHNIPMDVMILDMDWHTEGWTGWTWNRKLIPDPVGLLKWMHDKGLKVSMNLHPADGVDSDEDHFKEIVADMNMPADTKVVPWTLEKPSFYRSMFDRIIREREHEGSDFWWIDWQQNLTNPRMKGLSETFWCNHVFYNDMKINRPDRRPLIFHRWGGLGSHRYPIGFSGDSFTTYATLGFQPYFTATASNVLFGYWGHDLGGHQQIGNDDPELYLRWMQYGVFTPIFRTHATNWPNIERRIWKYPNFTDLLATVNLRYRLMPYIYTAAREAFDTGISICRPMYYDYPEEDNAYRFESQYFFGNDILVSPIVSKSDANGMTLRKTWLPEGNWYDVCRNKLVSGNKIHQDRYTLTEIPLFYKAGSVIVNYPPVKNLRHLPDTLILEVVPGADGEGKLYEDEGDNTDYEKGQFAFTRYIHKTDKKSATLDICPREGSYDGMRPEKSYEIRFLAVSTPRAIICNGTPLPTESYRYDSHTRCLTVSLDRVDCSKAAKLEVSFR